VKKLAFTVAVLLAPIAIGAAALATQNPAEKPGEKEEAETSSQYDLGTLSNSGQKGTVTLTAMGSKTKVVISLTGEGAASVQPAHIHLGSCPTPGAVKWPLTNVVHGRSVTVLDVPFSQVDETGFSVAVHQSSAHLNVYVACGNITDT